MRNISGRGGEQDIGGEPDDGEQQGGGGKGGKNRRRGKNENESEKRELVFKEDGQEYAQVIKMLGNGRLEAMCFDGVWINTSDIILIGLRDYQDTKADVILKYNADEARSLKAYGELPEHATREKELSEKEQRCRKQYERSMEERGRRLEEQRQKEERRRAAVDQKRRRREQEEKEHLEALMRRSEDRNLPSEQRPKRWTWGGLPRACEGDSKAASPSPSVSFILANEAVFLLSASQSKAAVIAQTSGRASPNPHKSSYKSSPSKAERKKTSFTTGASEESVATTPKTPQAEKEGGAITDPKHLESPMTPTKSWSGCKKPSTPKRSKSCRSRIQSPCSPGQYPTSPMRHRAVTVTPGADSYRRLDGDEKGVESKNSNTLDRKTSRSEKIPKSTSRELGHNAESPVTPSGKAGTTDAEEASRLLLKAEELQRKQAEERERQELAAQQAENERQRQEEERREKEENDKRQKERRLKELQDQLDREFKSEFSSSISSGSPLISLQPLESKGSAADDLSDGVQSMDVSPVSRDELMQEYSPNSDSSENLMRNPQALDLLHLTGQAEYPKAGDCNKNLIQSFSSTAADSPLIQGLGPSMDKLTV
ncbi:Eukaryotic translation initiation factor 1A [Bagarius yarrelli]|uniref:Eukaryotic translation initiation factor 1A n=1 Tax=Bagarius yarrelli TaxID=175774 RepID=A0A556TWM4_BAGYA|nr:Eukaryotic translation initiation factor 1A [Bagarius yarrelli]